MTNDAARSRSRRRRRVWGVAALVILAGAGVAVWSATTIEPLPETLWARLIDVPGNGTRWPSRYDVELRASPDGPDLPGWGTSVIFAPLAGLSRSHVRLALRLGRPLGVAGHLLASAGLGPPTPRTYLAYPAESEWDPAAGEWHPWITERNDVPADAPADPAIAGTWLYGSGPGADGHPGHLHLDADGTARHDGYPTVTRRWGHRLGIVYLERFGPSTVSDAPVTVGMLTYADEMLFAPGQILFRSR